MRTHIYVRTSKDTQAGADTLKEQLEACRHKAKEIGASSVTEYVDDGYPGVESDLPAIERLRKAVDAKQVDAIICDEPSRLGREPGQQKNLFFDYLKNAGVTIVFCTK